MSSIKYIPCDIETTALNFNLGKILGIGYGTEYTKWRESVPGLLTGQNFKFDYKWLKKVGLEANFQFDTMLAASILIDRPESLTLDSLASHYLGVVSWKSNTNQMFKEKNWVQKLEADPSRQLALMERNLLDLEMTSKLTTHLQTRLDQEGMTAFFFDKLMPAARLLADVEYRGMRLDIEATKRKLEETVIKIREIKEKLDAWSSPTVVNWNSPKQLSTFLKSRGYNLWIYDFKKKMTVESTGSDALERLLPNPNIELLLEYRSTTKLLGYLEGWLEDAYDHRLFPTYNISSTRTGRLSCSSPNLQQVPRGAEIRSLFVPTPGKVFVIADLGQIEPRIAAHYSKDEALLEVFRGDVDFYGSIAVNVLGVDCHPNDVKKLHPNKRKVAKEIGLSILYGIGKDKLSSIIKKKAGIFIDPSDCAIIIKDYFNAYPGLKEFREYVIRKIDNGEVLRTHYGRQFKLDPNKAFSTGVNTIIQSTASDLCLFSQLEIEKRLKDAGIEAPLVAIVHDEVIREVAPEDAEKVGAIMEDAMCNRQGIECKLKLEWTVAENWGGKA